MNEAVTNGAVARDQLRALVRSIAEKDNAALKALYERTSAKLYGICLRLLGDHAEAQDVLQEVYVTVWNKAALFDPAKASPITWLAALARNRSIDRLRSRGAQAANLSEDVGAAMARPDERPSAFDVLEQAEDSFRLHRCLEQLEAKTRAMIRAAFLDGATYSALAEKARVPLPTVKSRIRRGLIRLRECLEQ